MIPTTRYAQTSDAHIAFQTFGAGPDLILVPGFVSHIENFWDEPRLAAWLQRLASFCRVTMFDKRGTGLSSRVARLPTMDERMDDARAVMDAVGIEQAAVLGVSEGGSLATVFAAHHPQRCTALILYGSFAQFSSWFRTNRDLEDFFEYVTANWGTGESAPTFAPSCSSDPAFQQWWGRFERLGGDPRAVIELMRMNSQIDIVDILPTIHTPTLVIHRIDDTLIDYQAGVLLADRIPGARLLTLEGHDHLPFVGTNAFEIVEAIGEFVTGSPAPLPRERVLATVLFTDIVDSTALAHRLGDHGWRQLLDTHDSIVRSSLARYRGNEIKSLGDGFLATFDGPARAILAALDINRSVEAIGLRVRAGLHTGEVEFGEGDVKGIAVHIASRVSSLAGAGEVLVSRTVKDLVAGSGIDFTDMGVHKLKGIPDEWQVYLATD